MKYLSFATVAMAASLFATPHLSAAHAETTLCTDITALPFTITVQGIYCLKQNLNVNLATGNAITVNAANVTIDFNGWRINNQAPLATNTANGIYAENRKHLTLKNGFIRGFNRGIFLDENVADASASHLVEGMKIADSGEIGIFVEGDKSVLRDNRVLDTGGGSDSSAYGILLQFADNGLVVGNLVAGVSETSANHGVFVAVSNRVRVSGNEVTHVEGGIAVDRGITVQEVGEAIIAGNRLLNDPATGTGGIVDETDSTNIACLDNKIGGFTAASLTGCDVGLRNDVLFN